MAEDIKSLLEAALEHHRADRLDEAVALYRKALERDPENADALHFLGVATAQSGDPSAGESLIRRALAIKPEQPPFLNNLGKAVADQKRWEEAAGLHQRATELAPGYAEAWYCLGVARQNLENFSGAELAYRQAAANAPRDPRALSGLGQIFNRQGRLAEAAAYLQQAVQRAPDEPETYINLAVVLARLGLTSEAVTRFRQLIQRDPQSPSLRDHLIFSLLALPSLSNRDLAQELAAYERSYSGPEPPASFANPRTPNRRLRVGYLSSSIRPRHNLMYVMEAPLRAHDHAQFEIFVYGNAPYEAQAYAPLRALADVCRDTTNLDDAALADQIRRDGIDILVSVLGRGSASPRHTVLFHRPAPIQMAYQWVAGTGIPTVGYWLADGAGVPVDSTEPFHETILRLPQFLVFQPPPEAPPVAPLPAATNGFVTFGSFANTFKLNDKVFAAWAKILSRVPASRLALKAEPLADGPTRALVATRLQRAGLPMDRVIIWPRTSSLKDHLARYDAIDISLDTFPYTFGNTALESLWMGVPVVTQAGPRLAHRITTSILKAAGFPELTAPNPAGYVRKAVELAADLGALARWRENARRRLSSSLLFDYAGHTRALEQAYRTAWIRWCNSSQ